MTRFDEIVRGLLLEALEQPAEFVDGSCKDQYAADQSAASLWLERQIEELTYQRYSTPESWLVNKHGRPTKDGLIRLAQLRAAQRELWSESASDCPSAWREWRIAYRQM